MTPTNPPKVTRLSNGAHITNGDLSFTILNWPEVELSPEVTAAVTRALVMKSTPTESKYSNQVIKDEFPSNDIKPSVDFDMESIVGSAGPSSKFFQDPLKKNWEYDKIQFDRPGPIARTGVSSKLVCSGDFDEPHSMQGIFGSAKSLMDEMMRESDFVPYSRPKANSELRLTMQGQTPVFMETQYQPGVGAIPDKLRLVGLPFDASTMTAYENAPAVRQAAQTICDYAVLALQTAKARPKLGAMSELMPNYHGDVGIWPGSKADKIAPLGEGPVMDALKAYIAENMTDTQPPLTQFPLGQQPEGFHDKALSKPGMDKGQGPDFYKL